MQNCGVEWGSVNISKIGEENKSWMVVGRKYFESQKQNPNL
jgi:hypothetical protein